MRRLLILLTVLFFSCSTQKVSNLANLRTSSKILTIEEYDYAYHIKALNNETQRQINIISYKEAYFDKYSLQKPYISDVGLKSIAKDNNRIFELTEMRFNVNTMEQLGGHIIIEKDTIWSGQNVREKKFYQSQNSMGLMIKE